MKSRKFSGQREIPVFVRGLWSRDEACVNVELLSGWGKKYKKGGKTVTELKLFR